MNEKKKKFVLFVDDDPVALQLIVDAFKTHFGNDVKYEKASNPLEAEEILAEELQDSGELPALVVSDWMMPDKKGDVFLKELHSKYPELPLALCSGLADASTEAHIRKSCKLVCSLPKPWDGKLHFESIRKTIA